MNFGEVTVPDGKAGPWAVESFTISADECKLHNMRAAFSGNSYAMLYPGSYKRLVHERRGVVMSNTPMEVRQAREAYRAARGRVLINGLGLGMVLEGILSKADVTHVRVIEIDPDVTRLVGSHFSGDMRVEIICADAYSYTPAPRERFDYAWHDIWDDICADNLALMARLHRKYGRRVGAQSSWSLRECQQARRRGF